MPLNSLQHPDDGIRKRFHLYIRDIQSQSPLRHNATRGQYLEQYLEETWEQNWEGWSDAEIAAIQHFLVDLEKFVYATKEYGK